MEGSGTFRAKEEDRVWGIGGATKASTGYKGGASFGVRD